MSFKAVYYCDFLKNVEPLEALKQELNAEFLISGTKIPLFQPKLRNRFKAALTGTTLLAWIPSVPTPAVAPIRFNFKSRQTIYKNFADLNLFSQKPALDKPMVR